MKLYMALNEPGSGEISIHASDPAANGASMGKFVQMAYRGEARGGFFIEDIGKAEAAAGEKGEQWVALTGRGTLAILEEAIVWQEDGEATRTFEGLSMAGILLALIDEAQERGALAVLDTDFSATLDSASEAWEDSETLEFDVGTSLLDVARQFAELGIDFGITAWLDGQFRLSAYKNGLGLNKSASVILRVGQNCSELSDTWHGTEMRNALLTEYANGYVTKQDGTISTLYRRREGFFQANGAATSGAANRMAQAELTRLKDPMRAITVKVYDGVGPRVFVDYEAGDWVGLAREDGSVESWRVRGVQLEWQDDWYADVIVELNSVLMETELRMARQMRRVGGASVGAATSAPAKNDKAVKRHNADSGAHNGRLGNAERIWSRNITTQAPQDKHILRWDVATNMFVFSPIGDFPHVHSAADVTSGTLDGDRLPAMSESKQGAVPATGTPSGKYLKDNGTFDTPAGGSTPGGADTNVQVNDGGVLAGFSTFTFRKVNPALKVGNLLFDCADVTGSKAINWRDRAGIPAFTDELIQAATYPTTQFDIVIFKDDYSNLQDSGEKLTDLLHADGSVVADYLDFDTTPTETAVEGRLVWNEDEGTLDIGLPDGVTLQAGMEAFIGVRNATGSTISDGTPVMFAGTLGASGKVLITKAIADGSMRPEYICGILTHDIANNGEGKATWFGKVRGINTTGSPYGETWADGDIIYVSQITAGYLTHTRPAGGQVIMIAAVINAASNGTLLVRPTWEGVAQPYWDNNASAGRLWGGIITDAGSGNIDIAAGAGLIKTGGSSIDGNTGIPTALNEGQGSKTALVEWDAIEDLPLAGVGYNLVFWDASEGEFAVQLKENFYANFNFVTDFTVGRVYYDGSTIISRLCGMNRWNFDRRVQMFGEERFPVERATGLMLSATGTRNIAVTAGVIWAELVNRFSTTAFDSSGADRFTYWYRDGSGGWTSAATQSQINNTQYDDGDGTLGTLSNNRYGVHWVYVCHDSSVHVVYGQGNYTLANAQQSTPPASLPGLLGAYASFIGRIIIQKSAAAFTEVASAFTQTISVSSVSNHNDLSGLQGGTTDEYYHLTAAQNTAVGNLASTYAPLASPTFTGTPAAPTPTAGTNTTQIATTEFVTGAIRKKLTGNIVLYVATTGNDTTGDGTSGNPWATIQKAYDYIVANLDVAGYTVTIQVADGTYTAGLVAASSWSGGGSVVIQGNTGNKNSVYVSVTSKHCFRVSVGVVLSGALTLKYLKLATTTFGSGIYHSGIGIINFDNINFAACAQYHVICDNAGGVVYVNGAYEISGNAAAHWIAGGGGVIWGYSQTATISANLAFSLGFTYVSVLGIVKSTMTWSLGAYAVTGTRYHTYSNAAIYVASTGANHFPGNSAGVTDGYGYYG